MTSRGGRPDHLSETGWCTRLVRLLGALGLPWQLGGRGSVLWGRNSTFRTSDLTYPVSSRSHRSILNCEQGQIHPSLRLA